jgi:hypothetical protein
MPLNILVCLQDFTNCCWKDRAPFGDTTVLPVVGETHGTSGQCVSFSLIYAGSVLLLPGCLRDFSLFSFCRRSDYGWLVNLVNNRQVLSRLKVRSYVTVSSTLRTNKGRQKRQHWRHFFVNLVNEKIAWISYYLLVVLLIKTVTPITTYKYSLS